MISLLLMVQSRPKKAVNRLDHRNAIRLISAGRAHIKAQASWPVWA